MTDVPLVRMSGMTKRFERVLAVDNVTLDLMPGQVHALVGENGAGKTVLMSLLYGVHQPDAGENFGQRPTDAHQAPRRRDRGRHRTRIPALQAGAVLHGGSRI